VEGWQAPLLPLLRSVPAASYQPAEHDPMRPPPMATATPTATTPRWFGRFRRGPRSD